MQPNAAGLCCAFNGHAWHRRCCSSRATDLTVASEGSRATALAAAICVSSRGTAPAGTIGLSRATALAVTLSCSIALAIKADSGIPGRISTDGNRLPDFAAAEQRDTRVSDAHPKSHPRHPRAVQSHAQQGRGWLLHQPAGSGGAQPGAECITYTQPGRPRCLLHQERPPAHDDGYSFLHRGARVCGKSQHDCPHAGCSVGKSSIRCHAAAEFGYDLGRRSQQCQYCQHR